MTKLVLHLLYSFVCYLATNCVPVTWQAAITYTHNFTLDVPQVQHNLKRYSGSRHAENEQRKSEKSPFLLQNNRFKRLCVKFQEGF
jgi:hypothetical protein